MLNNMPRVLIADDDASIRAVLKTALTQINFNVVAEAENGLEALEKFKQTQPDFILLDINMPEKKGDEVLEEIKKNISDKCVIMISQMSEIDTVRKCIDSGAFYYIKKDVPLPQMLKIIVSSWEKFSQISAQKKKQSNINSMKSLQESTYRKIIEDKFFFMVFARGIASREAWQSLLEKNNSGYEAMLSLVKEKPEIKEDIGWLWATANNCSFCNINNITIDDNLVKKFPQNLAENYGIMPLYDVGNAICAAFSRPLSEEEKFFISAKFSNKEIDFTFSFPEDIYNIINKHYFRRLVNQ
jgi:two-component system chemotaxis response regulator CheY